LELLRGEGFIGFVFRNHVRDNGVVRIENAATMYGAVCNKSFAFFVLNLVAVRKFDLAESAGANAAARQSKSRSRKNGNGHSCFLRDSHSCSPCNWTEN